ncbi:hypothetical protein T08_7532 [Trichinella sp. T8]|nr:hypothetical protein T08_7532 [Trichinella sp. T8]
MQITIAITRLIISKGAFVCLIYVAIGSIVERSLRSLRAFKEWSKENVKTRTARSRTREGKRLGKTSSLEQHQRHLHTQPTSEGVF